VARRKKEGPLTVGYGGGTTNPEEFGPELGFGVSMYEQEKEPILIIKTSWGGKSLCVDFRSPSAGPYDFSEGPGKDYSKLLCHFIRDVRKDLNTPKMPFVIGVMGVGGIASAETEAKVSPRYRGIKSGFQKAMAAPAAIDEFKANVFAVKTGEFWPTRLAEIEGKQGKIKTQIKNEVKKMEKGVDQTKMSKNEKRAFRRKTSAFSKKRQAELVAKELTEEDNRILSLAKSSQGFHYFGCGKTIIQIGDAFAKALMQSN